MDLVLCHFKRALSKEEKDEVNIYDNFENLQRYLNNIHLDVVYPYLDEKGKDYYEGSVLDKVFNYMIDEKLRVVVIDS